MSPKKAAPSTSDPADTTQYIIRGIPTDLWRRVRARAAGAGVTARDVMLALIERYADGTLSIDDEPDAPKPSRRAR